MADQLTPTAAQQPAAPPPPGPMPVRREISAVIPAPPLWRQIPQWGVPIPAWPDCGSPAPWWWWVGVHGGTGVTTLTAAIPGSGDARRQLPQGLVHKQSPYVVAVCRTHIAGLRHAQDLAAQFAARVVPPGLRLVGLVTLADAPGRLPAPVRNFRRLVAGAYPRHWDIPWIAQWRLREPDSSAPLPPAVAGLAADLSEITGLGKHVKN